MAGPGAEPGRRPTICLWLRAWRHGGARDSAGVHGGLSGIGISRRGAVLLGAAAVLLGGLMSAPGESRPLPLTGLAVLGDSLSDIGNGGRFTNGPVWVEHIARRLGVELEPSALGGSNFAVGGARARGGPTDLRAQAEAFLASRAGAPDSGWLHVVFGGANDLLALGAEPDRDVAARAAAGAIADIVDDLAAAGAVHLLVPNLPDIGRTPAVRARGPAWVSEARRLTRLYNGDLERALAEVEARRSIRLYRLDVFALLERVLADPAAAGFDDVTTPCLGGACERALFWDELHPTAYAHARLAEAALGALGVPAAAAPSAAGDAPASRS